MAKRFTKENIKKWWIENKQKVFDFTIGALVCGATAGIVGAIERRKGYDDGYNNGMDYILDKCTFDEHFNRGFKPGCTAYSSCEMGTTELWDSDPERMQKLLDFAGATTDDVTRMNEVIFVEVQDSVRKK